MFTPMDKDLRDRMIDMFTTLCDEALAAKQPVEFYVERGMREVSLSHGETHERHEPDGSFSITLRGVRRT